MNNPFLRDETAETLLTGPFLRRGLSRRGFLRWTAMATAITGVAPILAACGDDDDDDDDTDATQPPASDATATTAAEPTSAPGGDATPTEAAGDDPTATTQVQTDPTATTEAPSELGSGGRLINGRSGDSDSLDPHRTVAAASSFAFDNIFDTLVDVNTELGYDPLIAEAYEISDDGLTYTWTIRDGITFHDGSPLTVEDVKFTFDRATNPDSPAQAGSFIAAFDSAAIVDDKTVTFAMKEVAAPFLQNISVSYFGILPKAVIEEVGEDFGTQPVGSGPWVFDEWIQGEQMTFTPYADYTNYRTFVQNTGAPRAEAWVSRVILEGSTLIAAFEGGELNNLVLPKSEVDNFMDNPDYNVLVNEAGTNVQYIEFATEAQEGETYDPVFKPPFDDLRLRQAVAYGVNVEEIIERVLGGLGVRNFGMMPTGLFAYDPAIEEFGYHHDPDMANQLLEEAGWVMGDDGVREKDGEKLDLEFWSTVDPTVQQVVQVIQNQLGEIGMKVNLESLEVGTLLARLSENAHNLNTMGVGWPEADVLGVIANDIAWGMGNYQPADYMELVTGARAELDQEKRKEMYFEAQKILLEDCPCVPMWTDVALFATRAEVKNLNLGPLGSVLWVDAWVEE